MHRQWKLEGSHLPFGCPSESKLSPWFGWQGGRKVILTLCVIALTSLSKSRVLHFRPGNTLWGSSVFPVSKGWLKMFLSSLPKKYRRYWWESLQVREERSQDLHGEYKSSAALQPRPPAQSFSAFWGVVRAVPSKATAGQIHYGEPWRTKEKSRRGKRKGTWGTLLLLGGTDTHTHKHRPPPTHTHTCRKDTETKAKHVSCLGLLTCFFPLTEMDPGD